MSAGGGLLSQVVGSLGGAPTAAALVAGGIVVGALGGGAVSGGVFSGGSSATGTGELAVYPCPDVGPALFTVPGGQAFLVTGKTGDGAWLRIHNPLPGRTEAWVETDPLTLEGALADLPVAECAPEIEAAAAAVSPNPSLTALQMNSPSPSPTPSPAPTENPRPSLKTLTASTGKISYDTASYCSKAVKAVTFKVKASDASGVAGVTLFWRKPGAETYAQAVMSRTAGTAESGTWQATLDTTKDGITEAGKLAFYAVAADGDGATRRLPGKGAETITVAVCANTGPTIKSASSSSGSSLSWDPLGVGRCRTATSITAAVSDVDGIESVSLFYRRPGSTTWSSKPMTKAGGKWSANLDTLGDKITIPDPPTGNLRWYIKAVDKKGVASQTKATSITVRRCDSEAAFDNVFPTGSTYTCTAAATISVETYANDADQPADGLNVVFHWTLVNPRTGAGPISGKMTANTTRGNYYRGTTGSFNGQTYYSGRLTVYAVTTDRYGGTTKSATETYLMSCR